MKRIAFRFFCVALASMLGSSLLYGQVDLNNGLRAHFDFNDNVVEQSGSGQDGILNGAFLLEDRFGNCKYSLGFDSHLQLMSMPADIIDGVLDISVSAWFKTTESGVFISAANGVRSNEFLIQILDDGRLSSNIRNIPNIPGIAIFGTTNVRDGEWHHVVLSREGLSGQTFIYLDGVLDGQGFMPAGTLEVSDNGFFLGNDQDCLSGCWASNQQFIGSLDDVRIYDRQLTLDEINFLKDIDESVSYPALELGPNIETCDASVTLDAGAGFDSYLWNTGETTQTISISTSGDYNVTTGFLACSFTDQVGVVIEELGTIDLTYSRTELGCNDEILIEATEGFDNYLWSNGEIGSSINIDTPGTYSVRGSNICGEVMSEEVTITGLGLSSVGLNYAKTELDCNDEILIEATEGFDSYFWSNGEVGRLIRVTSSGVYSVMASNACGEFMSVEVRITSANPEQVTLTYDKTDLGCDDQITIEADPGFDSYIWSNGMTGRLIIVNEPGTYFVLVNNECGELQSEGVIITSLFDKPIQIPNAFSPNGDGANDFFELPEILLGWNLKIFSRWGNKIFESSNYQNNWSGEGFPVGTYYYSINGPCLRNTIKGYVVIIR